MAEASSSPNRQLPLSVQGLRVLMREARGKFVPDHVAATLRHRFPTMVESDAVEIATTLQALIVPASERLHDAGIEPSCTRRIIPSRLQKREREYVTNVAALITAYSVALMHTGMLPEALAAGNDALAWCQTIDDPLQQSIAWRAISIIHHELQQFQEQEQACRCAIEAARRAGRGEEIVAALDCLCTFLIVRQRHDEAEIINQEALDLVENVEEAQRYYPALLMDNARLKASRMNYREAIALLNEALRHSDGSDPLERGALFDYLGSIYLRLGQFRECIDCQHQAIRYAEAGGSPTMLGWGYFRLAESHYRLGELQQAEEMLDRADACGSSPTSSVAFAILVKRAQVYDALGRTAEAAELCHRILENIKEDSAPSSTSFALRTLAGIAEQQGEAAKAEKLLRRAIEVAKGKSEVWRQHAELALAKLLHTMERDDEALELLDGIGPSNGMSPEQNAEMFRLRSSIAEGRGDFEKALEYERESHIIDCSILERRAEESLRNARIVAETDLLEREAEIERERRRRLEHELAEAMVELGDRKRLVDSVEQRLHATLERMESETTGSTRAIRETLSDLRSQKGSQESPLRYLGEVDDAFYRRLRERCPDLTAKQERLCGLLRAGLGSKEISMLLQLGPDGLKAQRKRLRKRLGLRADERLEVVLGEL